MREKYSRFFQTYLREPNVLWVGWYPLSINENKDIYNILRSNTSGGMALLHQWSWMDGKKDVIGVASCNIMMLLAYIW